MRVKAYSQLLESYRSLSLSHMARSFGVTESFMDRLVSTVEPVYSGHPAWDHRKWLL